MKNNRGNIILIFLVLFSSINVLFAQDNDYKWSASINKESAYVNESIYLKYVCEFKDRGELYVIEFAPKSTDKFEIIALSQSQKIRDYKRIQTYEYIVFAKVPGYLEFNFDISMKKTNKDSIENTVLGRDNAQFEEYSTKLLKQKSLSVYIKEAKSPLVGTLKLNVKKDNLKVKAYEPYHLHLSIDGVGNLESIREFSFLGVDAEVFASKAHRKYKLTKDGYVGTWSQKFAFVSNKNFKIPSVNINYLDISDETIKTMHLKEIDVEVEKAYTQNELLDEVDEDLFDFKSEYLYFVLTFIAGFLVAKVRFNFLNKKLKSDDSFNQKVKNTKTMEEIHMLLILQNSNKYKTIISDIESAKLNLLNEVKKLLDN